MILNMTRSILTERQTIASFHSLNSKRIQLANYHRRRHFDINRSANRRYRIYGESRCSKARTFNAIDRNITDIDKMSTCPWHVILDVDKSRIPESIAKAVCTCARCFLPDNNASKAGLCEAVMAHVPVIRKKCSKENVYEYSVFTEDVPVGCTCKRNVE